MPLTPQQCNEIYPLLDKVLALPFGKAIVYPCAPGRADYLDRVITGMRYETAIESIEMYTPDDPLHGKGSYANIWTELCEQGLLLAHLDAPKDTLAWRLIQCAATRRPQDLSDFIFPTARSRLHRYQKTYPSIMGPLWIEYGPPMQVQYAEKSTEELAVVDIDVDPSRKHVPAPTEQEKAKHRSI